MKCISNQVLGNRKAGIDSNILHNSHDRAQVHDKQAYVFEQVKTNVFVLVVSNESVFRFKNLRLAGIQVMLS